MIVSIGFAPRAVGQPRAPVAAHPDTALGALRQVHADHRELAVVRDPLHQLLAGAGQPVRAERRRGERGLEEEAAVEPLVHAPALHDAVPAADRAIAEARADPAGRLDAEVAADVA